MTTQWIRIGSGHYSGGRYDLKRVATSGDAQWRLSSRGGTSYHPTLNSARREAKRGGVSENPSGTSILIVGAGVALLGVAAYFLLKKPTAASTATDQVTSSSHQLPAHLGNPTDPSSVAYACNTCFKLNAIGHPAEAAGWCAKCTQGGGVVPTSASELYT